MSEPITNNLSKYMSAIGKRGGKSRWAGKTEAEKKAHADAMVKARKPKAKNNSLEGRDFNREKVRSRDNFTCQICKKKWKKGQRRFDVHHKDCIKDKTKQYDTLAEFDNLITLCHTCHLGLPEHRKTMSEAYKNPSTTKHLTA